MDSIHEVLRTRQVDNVSADHLPAFNDQIDSTHHSMHGAACLAAHPVQAANSLAQLRDSDAGVSSSPLRSALISTRPGSKVSLVEEAQPTAALEGLPAELAHSSQADHQVHMPAHLKVGAVPGSIAQLPELQPSAAHFAADTSSTHALRDSQQTVAASSDATNADAPLTHPSPSHVKMGTEADIDLQTNAHLFTHTESLLSTGYLNTPSPASEQMTWYLKPAQEPVHAASSASNPEAAHPVDKSSAATDTFTSADMDLQSAAVLADGADKAAYIDDAALMSGNKVHLMDDQAPAGNGTDYGQEDLDKQANPKGRAARGSTSR